MLPFKDSLVLLSLTNALYSSKCCSAVILGENRQRKLSRGSGLAHHPLKHGLASPSLILPRTFCSPIFFFFVHVSAYFRLSSSRHFSYDHSRSRAFSQFSAEVFVNPELIKSIIASLKASQISSPSLIVVLKELCDDRRLFLDDGASQEHTMALRSLQPS